MEKLNNIELRSEKVKNIVGKMPPALLRIGISMIASVIIITVGLLYYIPYPEIKKIPIKICKDSITSTLWGEAMTEVYNAKSITVGLPATITITGLQNNYTIKGIVSKLKEFNGKVIVQFQITSNTDNEHLKTLPTGEATVYISETPILRKIINR